MPSLYISLVFVLLHLHEPWPRCLGIGVGGLALSMDINTKIICWNVRGLNNPAKRKAVMEFITSMRSNLVSLQETKLDVINPFLAM